MFGRFTNRARRIIVLAHAEAERLDHAWIGPEHLLLGLIDVGEGTAAQALDRFGAAPEAIRADLEGRIASDAPVRDGGHIAFAPAAKNVLESSLREAIELGHRHIGTEHLLLALLRQRDSVAAEVLAAQGIEHDEVREWVAATVAGRPPVPGAVAGGAMPPPDRLDRMEARLAEVVERLEALERRAREWPT